MATASIIPIPWIGQDQPFPSTIVLEAGYDDIITLLVVILAVTLYASKGVLWDKTDPYRHKLYEKPQQRSDAANVVQKVDNLAKRLELDDLEVAVLWASQSGTAERLAGRLAKDLRSSFGAKTQSFDISDFNPATLVDVPESKLIVFMASTFGEGDPSDNLHQTWNWLRSNKEISLSNIRFNAFGLGNSNYKHYNHVIDILVEGLVARGAQMLTNTGKADDADGETEEYFLEWKQEVFAFFQHSLGYSQQTTQYEPCLEVIEDHSIEAGNTWNGEPYVPKAPLGQSKFHPLPVISSRNLLSDSPDRMCLHMEVDIAQNPNLKYKTGDHLAVWSVNPSQEVEILLRTLGLEEKRAVPIRVKSLDSSNAPLPSPTTLEAIFQSYLEICAPISREVIQSLVSYAPTEAAQHFLRQVSRDKAAYSQYSKTHYLNLGRLLTAACPTAKAWSSIPLSLVLEGLPSMQPRYYSISSSSVASPRKISITAVISDTASPASPERIIGLATNYLSTVGGQPHAHGLIYSSNLQPGHIYAAVRKSTFKLPMTPTAPILMVGAGTGVAPFRAFIEERSRLKAIGREVGRTRLFFGCRNASQDLLYAEDLAKATEALKGSFTMSTAFSRPGNGAKKQYVQDLIQNDAEAVCKLLVDENAYFYICGSATMARDVSAVIATIIKAGKGWSDETMKEFAGRQKRQRRWLQDVWG